MSKPNIDLTIFKNRGNNCNQNILDINHNEISDLCIPLQRLISSHNYYKALNVQNSNDHAEIFRQFMMEIYCNDIINDYEHLMNHHKHDLYHINQILLKESASSNCVLSNCDSTSRHYIRNEKINEIKENKDASFDETLSFFCGLFDSIHFYLYHSFECSLRIVPKEFRNSNGKKKHFHAKDENVSEFKSITEKIKKSRANTDKFQRFAATKFSIAANEMQITGIYNCVILYFFILHN